LVPKSVSVGSASIRLTKPPGASTVKPADVAAASPVAYSVAQPIVADAVSSTSG